MTGHPAPGFSPTRRASLLLPLFSIRSGDGTGGGGLGEIPDLARLARWAARAGFAAVQLLPFHEVGGGETSPYSSLSAFALDPVYVGLGACEDFLASEAPIETANVAEDAAARAEAHASPRIRWPAVRAEKERGLRAAFAHFRAREMRDDGSVRARALRAFVERESGWLTDFALYRALVDRYGGSLAAWPEGVRAHRPEVLAEERRTHAQAVEFHEYVQWQLDEQWQTARTAARAEGVELAGDLPFTVSSDAADVWAHPEAFRTDLRLGVPPDAFSADGQDWGLPVFDWDALAQRDFDWMRRRAARAACLCSSWRVDHVVGLYRSYFRRNDGGQPGFTPTDPEAQRRLGERVLAALAGAGEIMAEDLGIIPDFVRASLSDLGIPGMRVLRWEKDGDRYRDPLAYPVVSVATTGTHDTETTAVWFDGLTPAERGELARIPDLAPVAAHLVAAPGFDAPIRDALLATLYRSPSALVVVPLQDALGTRERVNLPGTVSDANWTYRMQPTLADLEADLETTARLRQLATASGRLPQGR